MPKTKPPANRYREACEKIAAAKGLTKAQLQEIAVEALSGKGKPGRPRKEAQLEKRVAELEAQLAERNEVLKQVRRQLTEGLRQIKERQQERKKDAAFPELG